MSSERPDRARRDQRDERLLELLFGGEPPPRASLEAARRDSEDAAALAELEAWLARTRAAAAADAAARVAGDAARAEALVARILERTVDAEEPRRSWREELRLFVAFGRERLGTSGVLRFAAASLLVHLCALPVFAWLALREPAPGPPAVGVELPGEDPFAEALPAEPLHPVEVEEPWLEPDRGGRLADPVHAENALRRARFVLLHPGPAGGPPLATADTGSAGMAAGPASLLAVRARYLHEGAWPEEVPVPAGTDPLSTALYAELLLDRYALTRAPLPALEPTLLTLERLGEANRLAPEARALVDATLARAAEYALWERPERTEAPVSADPFSPAWLTRFEHAVRAAGVQDDPLVARWLAWAATRR